MAQPQCPTLDQVKVQLAAVYNGLMIAFKQKGIDGLTIVTIGKILSRMTFEPAMTEMQVEAIISEEAETMLGEIKLYLLRQSVAGGSSLVN